MTRIMKAQHSITRRIEFDAAHRIPEHRSKCRHIHGHRYVLEARVSSPLHEYGSQEGMVTDFANLKTIMTQEVGEPWDHALLIYAGDPLMSALVEALPVDHKTVALDFVPTVENLARGAFRAISHKLPDGVRLVNVRLYETPNCWADYTEQEVYPT